MSRFDGQHTGYIEGARRNVPGLDGLHRMTGLLLSEHVPADGRVVVVGAGGGLELNALAEQHPGWSFDGVDPSSDMLALARETTASSANRVRLHHGNICYAPEGPYDGAVCLLVFHHISREERISTLRGIRNRLRPGSPFVLAHVSFAQSEPDRSLWIDRHIHFGAMTEVDAEKQEAARIGIKERLCIMSPEEEEAFLQEVGFTGAMQFYQAYSFRGWVTYA
jgi:tRNA (cmo5U34)-methyltransferase